MCRKKLRGGLSLGGKASIWGAMSQCSYVSAKNLVKFYRLQYRLLCLCSVCDCGTRRRKAERERRATRRRRHRRSEVWRPSTGWRPHTVRSRIQGTNHVGEGDPQIVRVSVRFSVHVYTAVFAGNSIDVMLTHDHDDNSSAFLDLLLLRWHFHIFHRHL